MKGFLKTSRKRNCRNCGIEFVATKPGHFICTKACYDSKWNKHRNEWRRSPAGRESTYAQHIKAAYGLEIADYQALLERQGGGCAICGKKESVGSRSRLHVDHPHGFKHLVRGILCKECNIGIGAFYDTPELMDKAAKYLRDAEEAQSEY